MSDLHVTNVQISWRVATNLDEASFEPRVCVLAQVTRVVRHLVKNSFHQARDHPWVCVSAACAKRRDAKTDGACCVSTQYSTVAAWRMSADTGPANTHAQMPRTDAHTGAASRATGKAASARGQVAIEACRTHGVRLPAPRLAVRKCADVETSEEISHPCSCMARARARQHGARDSMAHPREVVIRNSIPLRKERAHFVC